MSHTHRDLGFGCPCITYPANDTLSIQAALVVGFTCIVSYMVTLNIKWSDTEQQTTGAIDRRPQVLQFCRSDQRQCVLILPWCLPFLSAHHKIDSPTDTSPGTTSVVVYLDPQRSQSMSRLSVTRTRDSMAWRTTTALGPTRRQASDVARGAALCLTLYKVEPLLAVLCGSL